MRACNIEKSRFSRAGRARRGAAGTCGDTYTCLPSPSNFITTETPIAHVLHTRALYGLRTTALFIEDCAVRGVRAHASGACEPAAAHPSVASREGGLEVLIVDGAIEVALVHQRVDDAPDLRVGHAVRRHRVGASGATQ